MFVHYTFSSVWVAEWPPFEKELHIWLVVCSHCILSICIFFGFEGWIWVLIASVPALCIMFTFSYFPFGFEGGVCFLIAPVSFHCLLVTFISVFVFLC